MWSYRQSTGALSRDGVLIGGGYSGSGVGENNPAFERERNVGPIPQGWYTIGAPVDTVAHGPFVLPLTPAPENEMFGRSGFLIHGDGLEHPGRASKGCIVLARPLREHVAASGDNELTVIP